MPLIIILWTVLYGQTDARPLHRPGSGYHAKKKNKKVSEHLWFVAQRGHVRVVWTFNELNSPRISAASRLQTTADVYARSDVTVT